MTSEPNDKSDWQSKTVAEDNNSTNHRKKPWLRGRFFHAYRDGNLLFFVRHKDNAPEGFGKFSAVLALLCGLAFAAIRLFGPQSSEEDHGILNPEVMKILMESSTVILGWAVGLLVTGVASWFLGQHLAGPHRIVTLDLEKQVVHDHRLRHEIPFLETRIETTAEKYYPSARVKSYYVYSFRVLYDNESIAIYSTAYEKLRLKLEETLTAAGLKVSTH